MTRYREIAEVLPYASALGVNQQSRGDDACREMIAGAIGGRAEELAKLLNYSREEAKRILVSALARYLDERFSISSRRRLGLL